MGNYHSSYFAKKVTENKRNCDKLFEIQKNIYIRTVVISRIETLIRLETNHHLLKETFNNYDDEYKNNEEDFNNDENEMKSEYMDVPYTPLNEDNAIDLPKEEKFESEEVIKPVKKKKRIKKGDFCKKKLPF